MAVELKTRHGSGVRRGLSAALAAAALAVSAAACASTGSTSPSGGAHTFPTQPGNPSNTSNTQTAPLSDPACTAARGALESEGQDLASKLNDLPSAQAIASDLKVKLDAAATEAQSAPVKDAIAKLSTDFGSLATALAAGDTSAIQSDAGKYLSDATALTQACSS